MLPSLTICKNLISLYATCPFSQEYHSAKHPPGTSDSFATCARRGQNFCAAFFTCTREGEKRTGVGSAHAPHLPQYATCPFIQVMDGRLLRLLFSLPSGSDFKYSTPFRLAMPTP